MSTADLGQRKEKRKLSVIWAVCAIGAQSMVLVYTSSEMKGSKQYQVVFAS